MTGFLYLLLLQEAFNTAFVEGAISCKNAAGQSVDWFVIYKLPKTNAKDGNRIRLTGDQMAYYGSDSTKGTWRLLPSSIYQIKGNPVYRTLEPIYRKSAQVAYVAYNDQLPPGFHGERKGHSKGVLMAARDTGGSAVWLQHSAPRFIQDVTNGYVFPESGRENGQLFLCLSLPLEYLETIAYHLHVQAANVYQGNHPSWTVRFPFFRALFVKSRRRVRLPLTVNYLRTGQGRRILAIAKPPIWPKDIYADELKEKMNDSIIVQSWRNGNGGAQDKVCRSKYQVTDVEIVHIHTENGQLLSFSSREDHSKWSVTRTKSVFCFSSLNRMKSQAGRGGEITCLFELRMAALFKRSVGRRTRCTKEGGE